MMQNKVFRHWTFGAKQSNPKTNFSEEESWLTFDLPWCVVVHAYR